MTHVLTRVQQQMVDTVEQEGPGAKLHQNKKQVLQVALRQVKIFLGLSRLQQKECIACMDFVMHYKDTVVAMKAEMSDYVWVVEEGEVIAMVPKGEQPKRYGPGQAFGEMPLLHNGQQPY